VRITDPEGGVTSYTYGPFSELRTVTDPDSAVTTFERDAFGRFRKHVDPNLTDQPFNWSYRPKSWKKIGATSDERHY
jgi:YD repeat-containing protein